MKKLIMLVLFVVSIAGLLYVYSWYGNPVKRMLQPLQSQSSNNTQNTNQNPVTVIATNLEVPWAIAFLPDGEMLVTERVGRIRIIKNNKLDPTPFATIDEVKQIGEGGLLGIAVHPSFQTNHYIYLYYTYSSNGENTLNRVVRYTLTNNALKNKTVIVDAIPGSVFHNGGRIKFGPDKLLYITTGDAQEPSQAQDKNTLGGKILQVTDDSKKAAGNPFGSLVYSYGHRNPQGLAWDTQGNLWETEHGRSGVLSGLDEINLIEPGKNYGWPIIQGDEKRTGMETPKTNSGPSTTWAPSGVTFYNGSLFFAGLRGKTLYEAKLNGVNITNVTSHFSDEYGRLREVVLGPDNMLYVTTSNRDGRGVSSSYDDKVIRIDPSKL